MSVNQLAHLNRGLNVIEGMYFTDGENLYCVLGWTRTGLVVEDCMTNETKWKHLRKFEEMQVVTPNA